MNYVEFVRQVGKAGLSMTEFASLIKANANAVRNCKQKGVVPSHYAVMATLMGEMAEHGIDFKSPLLKIDIQAKKARGGNAFGRFDSDSPGE
jgi:hypothetical protein